LSRLSWLVLGTSSGIVAIFATLEASTWLVPKPQTPDEEGPAALETARAAPAVGVHGTVWRKFAKSAGATEMKAHVMTDRAPARQPISF